MSPVMVSPLVHGEIDANLQASVCRRHVSVP